MKRFLYLIVILTSTYLIADEGEDRYSYPTNEEEGRAKGHEEEKRGREKGEEEEEEGEEEESIWK